MAKNTLLVTISIVSGWILLFGGALSTVDKPLTLYASLDSMVNTICVWSMFKFSHPFWKGVRDFICCKWGVICANEKERKSKTQEVKKSTVKNRNLEIPRRKEAVPSIDMSDRAGV